MKRKTILIVDDDGALVEVLALRCRMQGFEAKTATHAAGALELLASCQPDLICLDVNMPGGDGLALCATLAHDPRHFATPVVIMTGDGSPGVAQRCRNSCVSLVQKGPDLWPQLESIIRKVCGPPGQATVEELPAAPAGGASPLPLKPTREPTCATLGGAEPAADSTSSCGEVAHQSHQCVVTATVGHEQTVDRIFELLGGSDVAADESSAELPHRLSWVLCIDDDSDYSLALLLRLERFGVTVVRAHSGLEGVRCASHQPADVILLDYEMPNERGDYILQRLKENRATQRIPVIVVTGRKDSTLERRLLSLGAAAFMTKPIDFDVLLKELRRHIPALREQSVMNAETYDDSGIARSISSNRTRAVLLR